MSMTSSDEVAGKRLERWQRSLLDLSLRNRMLDARESRTLVVLTGTDPMAVVAAVDEARPLEVTAALPPDELGRRLTAMARAARESLSESGARTLWIVLGTLRWYESPGSGDEEAPPRHAPLVMLPVEMRRTAAGARYDVRTVDGEDWRWNDTLVEKLKVDFGLTLPPPVRREDGDPDLAATFDAIGAAVASMARWEVVRECRLGILSFTKHVMWADLGERGQALLQAPVVAHLAAGGATAFPGGDFPSEDGLDARPPGELFAPLDCDASQLAAVLAAAGGRTFVLQGPPGTGKSQTITNLIAQCLATGKSVLFVAEKMAALEVVQRRLAAAGLADFCLEVHSHKAKKREVVTELARVLERVWRPNAPVAGQDERLAAARDDLNQLARALHTPGPSGINVHDALGRLGELKHEWRLDGDVGVKGVTAEVVAVRRDAVSKLAQAAIAIDPVATHPWHGSTLETWPVDGQERVAAAVAAAQAAGKALAEAVAAVPAVVPGLAAQTRADLEALGTLADKIITTPRPGVELVMAAGPGGAGAGAGGRGGGTSATGAVGDKIALVKAKQRGGIVMDAAPKDPDAWLSLVRQRRELGKKLAERWNDSVYSLDLAALVETFERWAGRFFLFRWFALRKPRREARKALAAGVSLPDDATVAHDLDQARIVEKTDVLLEAARASARSWLGSLAAAADDDGDLAPVEQAIAWTHELAEVFAKVNVTGDRAAAWRAVVATVSDGPDASDDTNGLATFTRLARAVTTWREALARLAETCGVTVGDADDEAAPGDSFAHLGAGHLAALARRTQAWAAEPGALRDWTAYARARKIAVAAGLEGVVAQIEAETVADDHVVAAWERALHAAVAEAGVAASPALARFHGATHQARIAEFIELDRAQLGIARARGIARLAERVPKVTGDVAEGGEIGVLLHEAKKQRRHRPLRALFREIPNLMLRLKPCLLMSPLSVAQYLDPESDALAGFDVVVFDEASQIPTSDAIGALARGKAAVVVGDSRQLPPTRFFDVGGGEAASGDADPDDVEELESILDECVAARLPELRLSWHYRSRHEDLIGFSNDRYYDGRLDVFPAASAQAADLGVAWRKVDGVYDRAGTRTNRAEAEAVVAEIVARLSDPERARKSIGVVTFSKPQQELVLDLLDEARRAQPELERFFDTSEMPEPVLVKNLETIQGDERDVVLFSIGYGPDRDGKVTMNFGPLNRDGGERRLNVAVTRAREQLVVFSSLDPDRIDPDVAALGVRHLGELLRYVRDGERAGGARGDRPAATPLSRAIGDALAARGWIVHHQVGCAGYRVDVAIVDPDDAGRYVLGLETDGPSYARAHTARDRDRLRAHVLGNLGWRLHRVWSLDWWHDPEKEAGRLHNAVIAAIAAARAARAPKKVAATRPTPAAGQLPLAIPQDATTRTAAPVPTTSGKSKKSRAATPASSASPPEARGLPPEARGPKPEASAAAAAAASPPVAPYTVAGIPPGRRKPDDLFDAGREPELGNVVDKVLEVEAPIRMSLLARRVGAYCGIGRVTARVSDRVKALAVSRGRIGRDGEADVVWRADQDATQWPTVRVPGTAPETKRDIDEVPTVEIAAAALVVLHRNIGLPAADLARETGKLLGFSRQGEQVKKRIAEGIAELTARGGCKVDDGRVSLPT